MTRVPTENIRRLRRFTRTLDTDVTTHIRHRRKPLGQVAAWGSQQGSGEECTVLCLSATAMAAGPLREGLHEDSFETTNQYIIRLTT